MRRLSTLADLAKGRWIQVHCITCGERSPHLLCRGCIAASGCEFAFRPLPCIPAQFAEGGFFLGRYATADCPTPIARALLRFKYHGDRSCGRFLKRLFLTAAPTLIGSFDIVVPVPLHRKRLRERGYNQAAWLARAAAKGLRVSLAPRALVRTRETPPQARASGPERRRGLEKAFIARARLVDGKRILLVDDVYTTGTTIAEAARALASAGASEIGIAVLLAALREP